MPLEPIQADSRPDALVETNPVGSDGLDNADDHMRNIKTVVKNFYTDFQNRTKNQIGLGNVQNLPAVDSVAGQEEASYVTVRAIRAIFGNIQETATALSVEEAVRMVPTGALISQIFQVSTNGPWRVRYYNLSI